MTSPTTYRSPDRILQQPESMRCNAPRLSGFTYKGPHRYFLTFCTDRRATVFTAGIIVGPLVSQLLRTATREQFAVLAYCFMPDHVHLLVEGLRESSDMRAFVHRWKQATAYYWKQERGAQLWQRGYYEHTLREEEDAVAVARYLVANPLRAGLVANALDYPYIGSQTMPLSELVYSVQASGSRRD